MAVFSGGSIRWLPALLLAAVGTGCGSHSSARGSAPNENDSGGFLGSSETSSGSDASGGDDASPAPPQVSVRIVHASPDAPAIDVCVAVHGTRSFVGPLLGDLDAGDSGLAFSQVSAYVGLDPAQYDVRIVAAGATSCASPLGAGTGDVDASTDASVGLPDSTNLPALAAGAAATLLVAGDLSPVGSDAPLGITLLADDVALTTGGATLRAINAVPSTPSLDLGLGYGTEWSALLTGVRFGLASGQAGPDQGVVDADGYLPIAPLSSQPMSARASGSDAGPDIATASSVGIDLGSIATVIAIGGKTGDATHPPALLLCTDNQPAGGPLSDCSVEPQ